MRGDLRIGGYTVAQAPNLPLAVALVALALRAILSDGTAEDGAAAIFYVAITIWAYEEAANGANGFRRALGIVALVLIAVKLAAAIR